jgi:beta-adrenergic-receptor kinase
VYKNFDIVISERWQHEVADTIFELVNQDSDKYEAEHRREVVRVEKGIKLILEIFTKN